MSSLAANQDMAPPAAMTATELRDHLHRHLQQSGVLTRLGTQLRAHVLAEISRHDQNIMNKGRAGPPGSGKADISNTSVWASGLADRLVEAHLRQTSRPYSHTLFCSEAAVMVPPHDGDVCAAADLPFPHTEPRLYHRSPLIDLVERALIRRYGGAPAQPASTQTDDLPPGGGELAAAAGLSMERRLALVDAQYALRHAREDTMGRASVEEALRHHRAEIEAAVRREAEHKQNAWRASELAEMRREEAEKYALMQRHRAEEQKEYERSVMSRVDMERRRLEEARADLEVHRAAVDKRGRDMLALAEERERALTQLERVISEQRDMIRKLQAQLTQVDELAAARLQEAEAWRLREGRRGEDIKRMQIEQAAELRARDDENAELRYRIKVMTEEYRHVMDRMSIDFRMATQQQIQKARHQGSKHQDPRLMFDYDANVVGTVDAMPPGRFPDYRTLMAQAQAVPVQPGPVAVEGPGSQLASQDPQLLRNTAPSANAILSGPPGLSSLAAKYLTGPATAPAATAAPYTPPAPTATTAMAASAAPATTQSPEPRVATPDHARPSTGSASSGSSGSNGVLRGSPSPIKAEASLASGGPRSPPPPSLSSSAAGHSNSTSTSRRPVVDARVEQGCREADKEREAAEGARKLQEEKERLERERLEKERLEKERQEREVLEKERLEKEREREVLEKERLEKERFRPDPAAAARALEAMKEIETTLEPSARGLLWGEQQAQLCALTAAQTLVLLQDGLSAEESRLRGGMIWTFNNEIARLKAIRDAERGFGGATTFQEVDTRPLRAESFSDSSDSASIYRKGSDSDDSW